MWSFHFVYKLKTIYSSKMVIEYSEARISLISSCIITNKTLILSLFYKQRSSYFSAKKRTWSERLRLVLRSFLKLESLGYSNNKGRRGAVGLTRNVEVVGLSPIKSPHCFLEQETLPLLLSTGWFQERIRAWFHNQTKINWGPYGRLT